MSVMQSIPVSKKKTSQTDLPESPRKTTMKVDAELLRKARHVALYKKVDLFNYIEGLLRPLVDADYTCMIRSEADRGGN